MLPIREVYWDDNAVGHLSERHITPEDIEEIVFGIDGDSPCYLFRKDGEYYTVSGQAGNGRLLHIVGEFIAPGVFRPFGARDMDAAQARKFRSKGK